MIKTQFGCVILQKVSKCKIKLELVNDSFTDLAGQIGGPPDTPVSHLEKINFFMEI